MRVFVFGLTISQIMPALMFFVLTLSPTFVLAATWTQYYIVTDVYPYSSGDIYFRQETQENPDNCNSPTWYRMADEYANKRETYALILSSIALGNKVRFLLDGCDGSEPSIKAVIMDVNQ